MKKIYIALVFILLALPIDFCTNIRGESEWWTVARNWPWSPTMNINDLIYFLAWDLSWICIGLGLTYISIYLIETHKNSSPIFILHITSKTILALACGKLIDEFIHPNGWHIGSVTVCVFVLGWIIKNIYKFKQKLKIN